MKTPDEVREIELDVQGMTWMGWEPKVVSALEELPGVKKAIASYPEKRAAVSYDPSTVSLDTICQKLLKAGYAANLKNDDQKASIGISGNPPDKTDRKPDDPVCYCFGYSAIDIEQDFIRNGQSLILEKIAAEKKAGGCDCANKNPKGRWCLADVRQVVDRLKGKSSFKMISWKGYNGKDRSEWTQVPPKPKYWMHQLSDTWAKNENYKTGKELQNELFVSINSVKKYQSVTKRI